MADEIIRDIFVRNRGLPVQIDYVQGTNAVPLKFQFRDYTVPSGAAARIYVKKPSGKEVYNSASLSGNTVTVQPTTQMFAEAGEQEGQLQLTSGQKLLVTFPILFLVERNLISESRGGEYGRIRGAAPADRRCGKKQWHPPRMPPEKRAQPRGKQKVQRRQPEVQGQKRRKRQRRPTQRQDLPAAQQPEPARRQGKPVQLPGKRQRRLNGPMMRQIK